MTAAQLRNETLVRRREPLLGWRLWRARGQTLESWAVTFAWEPGANEAHCLAPAGPCRVSPGPRCMCGYWAVFSPLRALARGRAERTEDATVLGLIRGWGEAAVHGAEGFRVQHAQLACLFADWVWDAPDLPCPGGGLERVVWLMKRRLGYVPRPVPAHPARRQTLEGVSTKYGVPLLTLADSLRFNVLTELGAGRDMIGEVRAWLEMASSVRVGQF